MVEIYDDLIRYICTKPDTSYELIKDIYLIYLDLTKQVNYDLLKQISNEKDQLRQNLIRQNLPYRKAIDFGLSIFETSEKHKALYLSLLDELIEITAVDIEEGDVTDFAGCLSFVLEKLRNEKLYKKAEELIEKYYNALEFAFPNPSFEITFFKQQKLELLLLHYFKFDSRSLFPFISSGKVKNLDAQSVLNLNYNESKKSSINNLFSIKEAMFSEVFNPDNASKIAKLKKKLEQMVFDTHSICDVAARANGNDIDSIPFATGIYSLGVIQILQNNVKEAEKNLIRALKIFCPFSEKQNTIEIHANLDKDKNTKSWEGEEGLESEYGTELVNNPDLVQMASNIAIVIATLFQHLGFTNRATIYFKFSITLMDIFFDSTPGVRYDFNKLSSMEYSIQKLVDIYQSNNEVDLVRHYSELLEPIKQSKLNLIENYSQLLLEYEQ